MPGSGTPALYIYGGNDDETATARHLKVTIKGITPVSVPISWLDSAKQLPLSDEYMEPLFQSIGGYDMAANGAPEIPEPIPDATIRQVAMFATMAVNSMSLSDEQALEVKDLYPEWASFIGKPLEAGFKVLYEGRLYKVRQQIATVLENQAPSELTAALYEEINETAAGTLEDPIPYNGNMALFEGKYYSQNGVTYKCTRSTGQAVYHDLSALVGLYVEKA